MKKYFFLFFICIAFLITGCYKGVDEKKHTIVEIIDGSTVKVKSGYYFHLVGIEPNEATKKYLEDKYLNATIDFVYDKNAQRENRKNKHFYGYIINDETEVCANSDMIQKKICEPVGFGNYDSIAEYQKYAQSTQYSQASTNRKKFEPEEIYKQCESSVFIIYVYYNNVGKAQGTGFVIGENNLAITNYHVIKDGNAGYIKFLDNSEELKIDRIVSYNKELDYAILQLSPGRQHPILPIYRGDINVGQKLYVLGNPRGLEGTFSQGVVSQLRNGSSIIQTDASISPGNSGSPMLNVYGEVVGLISFQRVDCANCNFGYNMNIIMKDANLLKL